MLKGGLNSLYLDELIGPSGPVILRLAGGVIAGLVLGSGLVRVTAKTVIQLK